MNKDDLDMDIAAMTLSGVLSALCAVLWGMAVTDPRTKRPLWWSGLALGVITVLMILSL